jgi:hypothetical protein
MDKNLTGKKRTSGRRRVEKTYDFLFPENVETKNKIILITIEIQ